MYIFKGDVHGISKPCMQELLLHTESQRKIVASAFQVVRPLLEKAEVKASQPNFLKTCFKGNALSAKAEVLISEDICKDVSSPLEILLTGIMAMWRDVNFPPRMGEESFAEVDKCFCNLISLT